MEPKDVRPRPIDEEKTDRQRKGLDGDAIAEMDRKEMDEPQGDALRSPTPGGDPEHRRSKPGTDETNSLTT